MPVQTKPVLKGYFTDGYHPNQTKYIDLIDTMGDGDMRKETYDPNDDGIVSQAGNADTLDGQHASAFAPSGYGLGTNASDISGTDLNLLEVTGFYRGSNLLNGPYGTAWTYLFVLASSSTYVVQEAWNYYTAGSLTKHTRRQINGVWESWEKVFPAQWSDIESKPTAFVPSSHTHSGGDISSAVAQAVNASTLDNLDSLAFHRVGAEILSSYDIFPKNDEAGLAHRQDAFKVPDEHFNVSSRPSGWSKRGTMVDTYTEKSNLILNGATDETYLYQTLVSRTNYVTAVSPLTTYIGSRCGVRLERIDNTFYAEFVVELAANYSWQTKLRWRSGTGDVVNEALGALIPGYPMPIHLCLSITGTRWSSWGISGLIRSAGSPGYLWSPNAAVSGLTWAPVRMGFVGRAVGATWESFYCDYFT